MLSKFVNEGLLIFLVCLSFILETLFVATIREFVTWVPMIIFVYPRPAEPYSDLSVKVVISRIEPSPSAERLVPVRITQLAYWPLVALWYLELTCSQYFSDCHAGQLMVHKVLNLQESLPLVYLCGGSTFYQRSSFQEVRSSSWRP